MGCLQSLLLFLFTALLLVAVSLLPFLSAFGHTRLPWPLRLIGRDADVAAGAAMLRASRAALSHGADVWAPYEAAVSALAGDLAARPEFSAFARGGDGSAPQLHVCAVASRASPGLDLLRESAASVGLSVTVLGEGDVEFRGWGDGLGRKLFHAAAFARSLPPSDFMLLVDAYDVVFLARPHAGAYLTALARALLLEPEDPAAGAGGASGSPPGDAGGALSRARAALAASPPRRLPTVLISAEEQCMEDLREGVHAPFTASGHLRFPCLNAGGVLGPAGAVAALLSAVDYREEMENDQRALYREVALARRDAALPLPAVDHFGDVFLSMLGVDLGRELLWDPVARAWRLLGAPPSAAPALWHWPGYFKRTSFAAGLLSGRRGAAAPDEVATAVELAWGVAAAAFCLGAAAATLAVRGGACACSEEKKEKGEEGGGARGALKQWPAPRKAGSATGCARHATAACGGLCSAWGGIPRSGARKG